MYSTSCYKEPLNFENTLYKTVFSKLTKSPSTMT
jgi:hypothetical protein